MFTFDFEDYVDDCLKDKNIPAFFREVISIKNRLNKKILPYARYFPSIPIHNDLVLQNLKFKNNKLSGILDFDDFCEGARISDIVNLLIDFSILKERFSADRIELCLDAYSEKSELTSRELEIFGPLFMHRIVMYIYFYYFYALEPKNPKNIRKAQVYYHVLKEIIGKQINYKGNLIKFEI